MTQGPWETRRRETSDGPAPLLVRRRPRSCLERSVTLRPSASPRWPRLDRARPCVRRHRPVCGGKAYARDGVGAAGPIAVTRTLVTGAAGFLGSHLVDRLLAEGDTVWGMDNLSTGSLRNLSDARTVDRFRWIQGDVTRIDRIPKADRYFHLASPASPDAYLRRPIETLRANSEGTYRVLEAARRHDAITVITSTSEIYGDPEIHPQNEAYWGHVNPIGVRSCYDEGKRYAEALAMAYRRRYDLDVRISRVFNTYGPRMAPDDGRVVSNFVVQALEGRPFTIHGTGRQVRSYCFVSDLVDGLLRLASAPSPVPTPMNLGNPQPMTVLETAKRVAKVLGVRPIFDRAPARADDPYQRCPDIALARRILRWEPQVPFERGVELTAAYFRTLPSRRRHRSRPTG